MGFLFYSPLGRYEKNLYWFEKEASTENVEALFSYLNKRPKFLSRTKDKNLGLLSMNVKYLSLLCFLRKLSSDDNNKSRFNPA